MYKFSITTSQISHWGHKCILFLLLGMLFSFANLHAREKGAENHCNDNLYNMREFYVHN